MGRATARAWSALGALLVLTALAGCGGGAEAQPTAETTPDDKTEAQACTDLEAAVTDFYEVASPGSTVARLDVDALPVMNGVTIPRAECAFEVRPDAATTVGDVFTIEAFFFEPVDGFAESLGQRLVDAGYRANPDFPSWSATKFGVAYSASILEFDADDDSAYGTAAGRHVLDLTIGQS